MYSPNNHLSYLNVVDKHSVKEFTAMVTDIGVVLCEKDNGSFLVLRYSEDLTNLKALLKTIEVKDAHSMC